MRFKSNYPAPQIKRPPDGGFFICGFNKEKLLLPGLAPTKTGYLKIIRSLDELDIYAKERTASKYIEVKKHIEHLLNTDTEYADRIREVSKYLKNPARADYYVQLLNVTEIDIEQCLDRGELKGHSYQNHLFIADI